jgi:GAF domain-containing protein
VPELEDPQRLITELAQLAADLGPALRPRSEGDYLQSIVDTARLSLDAAACSIAVLSEDQDVLEFRAASGEGAEAVVGMRIPSTRGIAGWAVASGQSIAIEDVARDPRFAADIAEATGYVPASIMAMPLESERQTYGVIEVLDRRRAGGDGEEDMELLAAFARQATLAVETAQIFANLAQALLEGVARAMPSGELRTALERQVAEAPRARAELAGLALLLHDLGRLGADERRTAVRLIEDFLVYARRRRR